MNSRTPKPQTHSRLRQVRWLVLCNRLDQPRRVRSGSSESALTIALFLASSIAAYALIQFATKPMVCHPKTKLTVQARTPSKQVLAESNSHNALVPETKDGFRAHSNPAVEVFLEQEPNAGSDREVRSDQLDVRPSHFRVVESEPNSPLSSPNDRADVLYVALASTASHEIADASLPWTFRSTSSAQSLQQPVESSGYNEGTQQLAVEIVPRALASVPDKPQQFSTIFVCIHRAELESLEATLAGKPASTIIRLLQECCRARLRESGNLNMHIESDTLRTDIIEHFENAGWTCQQLDISDVSNEDVPDSEVNSGSKWITLHRETPLTNR